MVIEKRIEIEIEHYNLDLKYLRVFPNEEFPPIFKTYPCF